MLSFPLTLLFFFLNNLNVHILFFLPFPPLPFFRFLSGPLISLLKDFLQIFNLCIFNSMFELKQHKNDHGKQTRNHDADQVHFRDVPLT